MELFIAVALFFKIINLEENILNKRSMIGTEIKLVRITKNYTRFIENLDKSDRLCLFQYTPLKEFVWGSVVNQRLGDWAIVTRGQGGAVW